MTGAALHNFDMQLCRYVVANIRGHLNKKTFAAFVHRHIDQPLFDCLTSPFDNADPYLLTDQDFRDLADTFGDEYKFDYAWAAHVPFHERHIDCVQEIRGGLASQYADEWATHSSEFARRLENDRTILSEGIGIVHEWVLLVRRYLRAMGATALLPHPVGAFPTPACPNPPAPAPLHEPTVSGTGQARGEDVMTAIAQVRDLLLNQKQVKDFYSTAEVAKALGRAEYTVREWCRLGRVHASKRQYARGAYPEWLISHDEFIRIQNEGILRRRGTPQRDVRLHTSRPI